MVILLDSTTISTVVRCTSCPYWWAFTWTRGEGWEAGARHESLVHPNTFQARDALHKVRIRHPAG